MATKASIIGNNIIDRQSVINLLKKFIFKNNPIELYDKERTYNTDDLVFVVNSSSGRITISRAREDGITGQYNSIQWEELGILDFSDIEDYIVISRYQPTSKRTKMWLTPDEYSEHSMPIPEIQPEPEPLEGIPQLLIDEGAIPLVEDTESGLDYLDIGHLVFDI